jgi:hypothetical protein
MELGRKISNIGNHMKGLREALLLLKNNPIETASFNIEK